ncbi:MAG: PHP domain-containing protein [Lachnospiraceae bacterium]|nr:PHP domain-containing protein [Lachnospiraceae bacterium]
MDNSIDLHLHSIYSDGSDSPEEIVKKASQLKLRALSLTDHDSVDGIPEMIEHCKKADIEFVPGIELSTDYEGHEIHILAYYYNYTDEKFLSMLSENVKARDVRTERILSALRDNGFNITLEDLYELNPAAVITRAHIATYLFKTEQIKCQKDAFDKYIGDGKCCFFKREKINSLDAIKLVKNIGGIAVIAHPPLYRMETSELDRVISTFKDNGLEGIEAIYSTYHNDDERNMRELAKKYNLLLTGGSDYHGINKPFIHLGSGRGNLHVPYKYFEKLKEAHFNN